MRGDSGASPPASPEESGPGRRLAPLGGLSLGTRLMVAFGLLAVLLASGFLGSGIAIFARRSQALVQARLAMDVAAAERILQARQGALISVGRFLAQVEDPDLYDRLLCGVLDAGESGVDLALRVSASETELLDLDGCHSRALPAEVAPRLGASDLGRLYRVTRDADSARSGFVVVPAGVLPGTPGARLAFAAASPLPDGAIAVLATLVDGRSDLAIDLAETLSRGQDTPYQASLFRGDVRVASSLQAEALGTAANANVARTVLERGEAYVGSVQVLGQTTQAAYVPLCREDGSPVGMLGIATLDDLYGAVRTRTVNRFVLVGILGLLVALASSWLLSKGLVRPIRALAEGMTHVAQGDLDFKVRVRSGDELGQLARAFNRMVRAVKERDIRLQDMTTEKLSLVERQVSVGRLAAGVAHEINNPLTAILTLSMLLRRRIGPDDPRVEDLDIICEEAARCRDIVRSLLDFARERPTEMAVVDVREVVDETCTFVSRYGAFAKVDLGRIPGRDRLLVQGDAKQLQQVVTNLLLNAAEASTTGGTVRISVEEDSSGGFVHVVVEDHGRGISAEALGRIFEPFFTTKEGGTGTGLGLPVSLGIVQKHGGTIRVESEEGHGTRVIVVLPRLEEGMSGR
ncbi:MAG: HAMP domain-containing protein [Deltaproteobacteria bacterium]|nr:HAMP domain-containing protein [Deltaproteobacteria bacterium]